MSLKRYYIWPSIEYGHTPVYELEEDEEGEVCKYKDVKEAVLDCLFILDSWNSQDFGKGFNEDKFYDICEKYSMDLNKVMGQDVSYQEILLSIFGDFEKE